MAPFTGYCRGCNREFRSTPSGHCPQCGAEMTVAGGSATVELVDTLPGKLSAVATDARTDLAQQLVGSVLGLYTIEAFLGRGGMAAVFRARHNMLLRACAVKVLCPDFQQRQADCVDLFLSEARTAAALTHPHVVTVHNIGQSGAYHFIELEFIPGQSLQHLASQQTKLGLLEATGYLVQTCSGLAAAHGQGLVHRDFKPANILVRDDGVAKLADFGLAKRVGGARPDHDEGLAGTPYFMAPELYRGQPGSMASDVYAVGVSYYYLLTGHFPFTNPHVVQLGELHAHEPVPDPRELVPDIPERVAQVIFRAMAKQPQDRYASAAELYGDLQSIQICLRSLTSLVREALDDSTTTWEQAGERIVAVVPLANGRTQSVYIEEISENDWKTSLVRIYSICGPVDPSYYRRALELNAHVPHGSLAIESVDGSPHFVMLNCYPRATCDPEEIRRSVDDIARWADDVENALTGKDRY